MDISTILPLLMSKASAKNDKMDTLLKFAQGEKPDVGTVMNMAMANKNRNRFIGLRPVSEIASYEIMGKLAKYFLN